MSTKIELRNNEAKLLKSFLDTTIFGIVGTNNQFCNEDIIVKVYSRTKYETIEYRGYELDVANDFRILHALARARQQSGTHSIIISEKAMIENVNCKNLISKKEEILQRLERMVDCSIKLIKKDANGEIYATKKISLISEVDWDKRNKLYQITLPPAMVDIENFWNFEIIDISDYHKIRSMYGQKLWMFYAPNKYRNNENGVTFPMSKLTEQFGDNNMPQKELNRKVKQANEQLIDLGFLKDVNYFKSNGKQYCHILANWHKNDKIDKC